MNEPSALPRMLPAAPSGQPPRVTIVMSFRERWSLTQTAIESVVACTPRPYRFWLLDTGIPARLREALEARQAEWGLEIVTLASRGLWPGQARGLVAPRIDSPYAVFIDNDVLVMPGWLDAMLACAEDTGAGIVGPLYLWGENAASDLIHMAGGELKVESEGAGQVMRERHRLINRRLSDVESQLRREPCGFVEFHCLMMRAEVLHAPGVFDPQIVCVHEHIHASLTARALGYETWTEPAARVNYLARSPWRLGELSLLRQRWSHQAAERSIQRFAQRWNAIDDERSFGPVRKFVLGHAEMVDLLRAEHRDTSIAASTMQRADLEQTPGGLLLLARRRGYSADELRRLGKACVLAMRLSEGVYRPCGRPFLNHLVGTASVLVHYGFTLQRVLVALLHAAYSHAGRGVQLADGTLSDASTGALPDAVTGMLGGVNSPVMAGVRAYTERARRYRDLVAERRPIGALGMDDVELLLLEAANDIDMHLSSEVAFTGRADVAKGPLLVLVAGACRALGVPGMADTLREIRREASEPFGLSFHREPGSFMFTPGGTRSAVRRPEVPGPAETA